MKEMKKLLFICVFSLMLSPLMAQTLKDSEVPKPVIKTFTAKYPKAEGTEWTKNKEMYEAKVLVDSNTVIASYDEKGNWIQTLTSQAFSNLPITVIVTVATKLEGQRISDSFKLEEANGKITYKVFVNDLEYVLGESGNILTKDGKEYHEEGK